MLLALRLLLRSRTEHAKLEDSSVSNDPLVEYLGNGHQTILVGQAQSLSLFI